MLFLDGSLFEMLKMPDFNGISCLKGKGKLQWSSMMAGENKGESDRRLGT